MTIEIHQAIVPVNHRSHDVILAIDIIIMHEYMYMYILMVQKVEHDAQIKNYAH